MITFKLLANKSIQNMLIPKGLPKKAKNILVTKKSDILVYCSGFITNSERTYLETVLMNLVLIFICLDMRFSPCEPKNETGPHFFQTVFAKFEHLRACIYYELM